MNEDLLEVELSVYEAQIPAPGICHLVRETRDYLVRRGHRAWVAILLASGIGLFDLANAARTGDSAVHEQVERAEITQEFDERTFRGFQVRVGGGDGLPVPLYSLPLDGYGEPPDAAGPWDVLSSRHRARRVADEMASSHPGRSAHPVPR